MMSLSLQGSCRATQHSFGRHCGSVGRLRNVGGHARSYWVAVLLQVRCPTCGVSSALRIPAVIMDESDASCVCRRGFTGWLEAVTRFSCVLFPRGRIGKSSSPAFFPVRRFEFSRVRPVLRLMSVAERDWAKVLLKSCVHCRIYCTCQALQHRTQTLEPLEQVAAPHCLPTAACPAFCCTVRRGPPPDPGLPLPVVPPTFLFPSSPAGPVLQFPTSARSTTRLGVVSPTGLVPSA